MKKKSLLRDISVALETRQSFRRLETPVFEGYASLLNIERVKTPLIKQKFLPQPYTCCIANDGYLWLTLLPDEGNLALTGIFDAADSLLQVYVDVTGQKGVDEGVPWFYDLYVDIILFEENTVLLDDVDELQGAFLGGRITKEERDGALLAAKEAERSMLQDPCRWRGLILNCLNAYRKAEIG